MEVHGVFSRANTKFCLSLHYNGDEIYLYVHKTKIHKFKVKDNVSWYNFCLGRVYHKILRKLKSEISLNGTLNFFQLKKKNILIFTNI